MEVPDWLATLIILDMNTKELLFLFRIAIDIITRTGIEQQCPEWLGHFNYEWIDTIKQSQVDEHGLWRGGIRITSNLLKDPKVQSWFRLKVNESNPLDATYHCPYCAKYHEKVGSAKSALSTDFMSNSRVTNYDMIKEHWSSVAHQKALKYYEQDLKARLKNVLQEESGTLLTAAHQRSIKLNEFDLQLILEDLFEEGDGGLSPPLDINSLENKEDVNLLPDGNKLIADSKKESVNGFKKSGCDHVKCPHPFQTYKAAEEHRLRCACDCPDDHTSIRCKAIKRGLHKLSQKERRCVQQGLCLEPTCEYSGNYDTVSGRCPKEFDWSHHKKIHPSHRHPRWINDRAGD